ncbi:MAG: diguanylate cyclase [Terracidiphilus sp.]
MISLKKYMDSAAAVIDKPNVQGQPDILSTAISVYGSALIEMGNSSLAACPGVGDELKRRLGEVKAGLSRNLSSPALAAFGAEVQEQLQNWGRRTARHYQEKAGEVKELLIVMARTAESVGARDQRCAGQMDEVTSRLKEIASLDDLTEIRASIEKSAVELRTSIERMTSEGKAAIEQLREQVSSYQAKLEEAEEIASRDALTAVRSRLGIENLIESRIGAGAQFCVAMLDIDDFKKVNDEHGHGTGDELLKQFAAELRSACRSTDAIGRWGGDEFIVLFEGRLSEAEAQKDRLRKWVCGNYSIPAGSGVLKLKVDASIGLAEFAPGEPMKGLLARADAAMYAHKASARNGGNTAKH